ncbi:MAG: cupredoxin domain-containing protein [Solirubrobacteraceae bacterium]
MPAPRTLALTALLALALGVSGCGGDNDEKGSAKTGEEETSEPTGAPVAKVAVSETDYKLKPADPKVTKAGVVEFEVSNDGDEVHSLEIEGPSGEAKTTDVQPGAQAKVKVDLSKPGTYEMYCPIDGHKGLGMRGEVTVTG